MLRILYVEPFEGGSHASFTRAIQACVPAQWTVLSLPARHWKWRMRGSAVWAVQSHPETLAQPYDLVFASSFVPLAELVGLCPALASTPRVLYFHENQLAYPWQQPPSDRDLHYGVTQLVSALAATVCVFNSAYNRDSLLDAGRALLRRMPDAVPPGWIEAIEARSRVLGVPLSLPDDPLVGLQPPDASQRDAGPLILWSHRWEHDKNPEAFFGALQILAERGVAFRLAVCGERFARAPEVFARAQDSLSRQIVHWGHIESRADYHALLQRCDIAVSTARHEFFGIAMLEATHFGVRPLVPDRLAYPELYPPALRYPGGGDADADGLVEALARLCEAYAAGQALRADRRSLTAPFTVRALGPRFAELLAGVCQR